MIEFLKYLHYRLYSWNLKTWGAKDGPAWNAFLGVSFLVLLNLSIPLFMLQSLTDTVVFVNDTPKAIIIAVALAVEACCFFLFNYKKKYLNVAKKYENETNQTKRIKILYCWLYVVLSFAVPILIALYL